MSEGGDAQPVEVRRCPRDLPGRRGREETDLGADPAPRSRGEGRLEGREVASIERRAEPAQAAGTPFHAQVDRPLGGGQRRHFLFAAPSGAPRQILTTTARPAGVCSTPTQA